MNKMRQFNCSRNCKNNSKNCKRCRNSWNMTEKHSDKSSLPLQLNEKDSRTTNEQ